MCSMSHFPYLLCRQYQLQHVREYLISDDKEDTDKEVIYFYYSPSLLFYNLP